MALEFVKLVLSLVFTLNVTCQGLKSFTNGDFVCREDGTVVEETGNDRTCNKDNSALRYQIFGIDCCIEEAQENMKEFFEIFEDSFLPSFNTEKVSC